MGEEELQRLYRRVEYLELQVMALSMAGLEGTTFELGGEAYEYVMSKANRTYSNERAVELPVAWSAVQRAGAAPEQMLEVGNVLGHYFTTNHPVLDKYEIHPKVNYNIDVLDFEPAQPLEFVVSVSTLEHVGWSETPRDRGKFGRAIDTVAGWLAPSGSGLVTLPLGANPGVDEWLAERPDWARETRFLRRLDGANRWREASYEEVQGTKYGKPYPAANAVAVVTLSSPHRGTSTAGG